MTQPAELFDLWKTQMEEGARTWARMVGQASPPSPVADPFQMWRPFMEQAADAWTKASRQGTPTPDVMAQGKAFLDQWIAAWDKIFADSMQTEAFAQALGKHLDQWLDAQAPVRKAAGDSIETTLQTLGMPSRRQVVALAQQLMDLDDRVEELDNHVTALREQLDRLLKAEGARPKPARKPGKAAKR